MKLALLVGAWLAGILLGFHVEADLLPVALLLLAALVALPAAAADANWWQAEWKYAKPRAELSENAPTMLQMKIDSDKIRDVIGKGGATIRDITEKTGASVDINDDGEIKIFATDKASADAAVNMIEGITADIEVGVTYEGKVSKIVDFGAFITVLPGKDGLLHISQISEERVENVSDYLSEGQTVKVHVMDVDPKGRVKLTMKGVEQ